MVKRAKKPNSTSTRNPSGPKPTLAERPTYQNLPLRGIHSNQRRFLAAYCHCGIISKAARIAKVHPKLHFQWVTKDKPPKFLYRNAWKLVKQIAADYLEEEARRRALEGVQRLVFYKGKPLKDPRTGKYYLEHEFSDSLMMFLLKANAPKKFRENSSVEIGGKKGQPIQYDIHHDLMDITKFTLATQKQMLLEIEEAEAKNEAKQVDSTVVDSTPLPVMDEEE